MKKFLTVFILFLVAGVWGYLKYRAAQIELNAGDAPQRERILHLFAMSDYFPVEVIKDFEAKNNCKIQYDNFASNEELLAKLQAGAQGYDVIIPSDYIIRALILGKMISEIDKTKLPHFINLSNDFVEAPFDLGSHYTVPYTWGTTGLIYNTKFVKAKLDSWDVLFDSQYAGRISLLDDEREVLGAMLHKLGFSSNTTNPKELRMAQELLIKMKPRVRLFATDPKQYLISGDVWIAHIYSGDAEQVIKNNPQFVYVTPKEGGTIWMDTLAIPQKAPNADLAYKFIDNILETGVARKITEQLLYSSPNSSLENLVAQENLKPSFLKKLKVANLEFLKDLGPEGELWDQIWTEAKSH